MKVSWELFYSWQFIFSHKIIFYAYTHKAVTYTNWFTFKYRIQLYICEIDFNATKCRQLSYMINTEYMFPQILLKAAMSMLWICKQHKTDKLLNYICLHHIFCNRYEKGNIRYYGLAFWPCMHCREKDSTNSKQKQIRFFSHLLGELRIMYVLQL